MLPQAFNGYQPLDLAQLAIAWRGALQRESSDGRELDRSRARVSVLFRCQALRRPGQQRSWSMDATVALVCGYQRPTRPRRS